MSSLIIALTVLGLANPADEPATDVRVMSFNIRYGSANDGPNAWPKRRELLFETIRKFNPDLLGTQETLNFQRDDLAAALPGYDMLAAGRDDGREKGEMMALYYRKARFDKLDGGHFWLSQTPDTAGSKSLDSSLPRMVTWVKLRDRLQPDAPPIAFFNTHFDHRGAKARAESARLIRSRMQTIGKGCRLILAGDFNAAEVSEPYQILFAPESSNQSKIQLLDTYRVKHSMPGPGEGTFSNFQPGRNNGARIDWIGTSPDFQVISADIDRSEKNGRTPSDHFPIFAVLRPGGTVSNSNQIRVLCYNIFHGEGMDHKFDLERIARIIRDCNPDFVALQEVDHKTQRSHKVDQTAELAKLTGLHGQFGRQIDYEGGEYGQAILSRVPIEMSQIHWLPGMPERERRIAFEVSVQLNGQHVQFITTHLHHANAKFREMQVARLNEIYANSKGTVILAGDMNATPGSEPINLLKSAWSLANTNPALLTYPADKPVKQIDYICYRSQKRYQVIEQKVLQEPVASDHRPVLIVLEKLP